MEFDEKLRLNHIGGCQIKSDLSFTEIHKQIWELLAPQVRNIGEGTDGEIWLDYSDKLITKHIVLSISEEEDNIYNISIKAGRRSGHIADILLMLLGLCAFWGLSKCFSPHPPAYAIIALVCSSLAAGRLYFYISRSFGRAESEKLIQILSKLNRYA